MPSFSTTLEQTIHKALSHANERAHEFATLEHLLLALLDEPDAQQVMRACDVDISQLRQSLTEYIEDCLLYTSPSPRDRSLSRMPSSA